MLFLKIIIVPFFILLVTLAGRKWGTKVAGILGGMPVVAGPIVVLLAVEQGQKFGIHAATSAIISVIPLLVFGIIYCWMSLKFNWVITLITATLSWLLVANILILISLNLVSALCLTFISLWIAPQILPQNFSVRSLSSKSNDLVWRLIAGALLTVTITQSALQLGERWSGMLAVFPVIGSILAVFTHRSQGAENVTLLYRGMMRGLYSLVSFFCILAFTWGNLNFWLAVMISIITAILIQIIIQIRLFFMIKKTSL